MIKDFTQMERDVVADLKALRELEVITHADVEACVRYLQNNLYEVDEWVSTMGVSEAVDLMRECVRVDQASQR